MRFRVGIDIGGTFTDVVAVDQEGCLHVGKVSSTPPDYSLGVIRALKSLDIASSDMDYFSHGSTVATNAVLQRRGARTGLITTRGFEDVLEIARADREELFNYWWVPRHLLCTVGTGWGSTNGQVMRARYCARSTKIRSEPLSSTSDGVGLSLWPFA